MSPCDATLRLFLAGFLALTQDMQEGPCYSTRSGHSPSPALSCCQCFNLLGVVRVRVGVGVRVRVGVRVGFRVRVRVRVTLQI